VRGRAGAWRCGLWGMLLVGCASAPIQEMSDARQALQAAEHAGASQLSPRALGRAKAHLRDAEEALGVRAYREARHEAQLAREQAIQARSSAGVINSAEAAVREAARLGNPQGDTAALLDHALEAARRGKEDQALALARQATEQAGRAINEAYLRDAWSRINRMQSVRGRLSAAQRARLHSAEEAYWKGEGQKALEILRRLMSTLPPELQ
jgi:hypothetical protein